MKTTKAIGYARVSTQHQAQDGVSLSEQRERITMYAMLHGLELVDVVSDDGVSGKRTDNRPALQGALKRLRAGEVGALVVVKLDRLTRSVRDAADMLETCERQGWDLHSIGEHLDTSSAAGRFVVGIFAGLAQLEREQTSERTKAALGYIRREGRKTGGGVPYGYTVDGDGRTLVPDEVEQEAISLMVDLRAAGLSWSKIARELNDRGVTTKRGKEWAYQQVQNTVKRYQRDQAAA